jgi:ATP-binding cassette, subfamily G (WHITE), eye pigment precursor transporter
MVAQVLMDPSVLFADEPTSGLDAFMAESVIRQLQTLAQAGRCIISTIHQPSTDVYGLFSKIMLLSEGKVVYFGPTAHVINYFNGWVVCLLLPFSDAHASSHW